MELAELFNHPVVRDDTKFEFLSNEIIGRILVEYLKYANPVESNLDYFKDLIKLSIRYSHETKLKILRDINVPKNTLDNLQILIDKYEIALRESDEDLSLEWRLGHTSTVSSNAMLAMNMNHKKIIASDIFPSFIDTLITVLKGVIELREQGVNTKKARAYLLDNFNDTSKFPSYINIKTICAPLYALYPEAFPLINDYVLKSIKKITGPLKMTPTGYIQAAEKLEYILKNHNQDIHFGKIDRAIALSKDLLEEDESLENLLEIKEGNIPKAPLNQILYGPPGTGKTRHTIIKSLEILDPELYENTDNTTDEGYQVLKQRFDELRDQYGQIEFVTFHQSFSYEDFVEGIRATENEDGDGIQFNVEPGIFKQIRDKAANQTVQNIGGLNSEGNVWKISIHAAYDNQIKSECFETNTARIGWDCCGDLTNPNELNQAEKTYFSSLGKNDKNSVKYFNEEVVEGDLIVCIGSNTQMKAVGIVTKSAYYDKSRDNYKNTIDVNWLHTDLNVSIKPINGDKQFSLPTFYPLSRTKPLEVLEHVAKHTEDFKLEKTSNKKPYVLIIDEINRGNISRIFGELITLLEPNKRLGDNCTETHTVRLPYSKKIFSIPDNLYIIGTMNTADKSLMALDTALRRRFVFEEMQPDSNVLAGIKVDKINIRTMFEIINKRIQVLLDRDHTIGHSYFLPLKAEPTLVKLEYIFSKQIIPLLQEYFFDDWERIQWVLGENVVKKQFEEDDVINLFDQDIQLSKVNVWEINSEALTQVDTYTAIYSQGK